MNRLLFFLIFALLGALGFGWWHNYSELQANQSKQINQFISAGPRFTAEDGQRLCERVAELEKHSIGFQRSGVVQPPCSYYLASPTNSQQR